MPWINNDEAASLASLLAVALMAAACGGGDDTTSTPGASTDGSTPTSVAAVSAVDSKLCPVKALETAKAPVEIVFWHAMAAANETALKALVAKYNASQTKVKVDLRYSGTYDETIQKYVAGVRGGELPSLVQTEETAMQTMMDSKSIVPIGACVLADSYDLSDFAPALVRTVLLCKSAAGDALPVVKSDPVLQQEGIPGGWPGSREAPGHVCRDP